MVTTKLVFDRKKQASRKEPATIEIRIIADRRSYYISTGLRVLRSEFVAGQICNRSDADILNERLRLVYNKTNEAINNCLKIGAFSIDSVRRWLASDSEVKAGDKVFLNWIEKQILILNIVEGTRKHYRTMHLRLSEWGGMKTWADVSVENIYQWDAWLHKLKAQDGGAISDGGVWTYHKCLKSLLNIAVDCDIITSNPYDRLRGKFKRGEKENIEFLTEEEMKRFECLILPAGSSLDIAHDLFIFQMYTGLSFSDAMAFDIRNYKKDGDQWKHTGARIKTGVPYVSSLLPPVVRVLGKYGMKVPQMDNSDDNRTLKALGIMAGINIKMHSHLARHTFATYMLRNGVKIENVSKMLGHTNITQTQRYAKVLAQSVHEDFDKIAKKLKNR